jgi:acyl-coenzyme A thioesterase PaaI-like protein
MVAIIGQILFCLLFAATVGFLTAWFLRRSRVDELTLEVERLKQSSGSFQLGPLEKKVDALGVLHDGVSAAVSKN